jgi:hypothetical protein
MGLSERRSAGLTGYVSTGVSMKVLVACEFSGTVRDAFIAQGHDAMSCDLLPTEVSGPHYQGDVRARIRHRKACEDRVRAKFPTLIEGSNGWHRAMNTQLRKRAA